MSVSEVMLLNNTANDAEFRTFCTGIHNLLSAAGLTQTADTGQINLATVLRPASDAVAGYEIWRFNDTEQASCPVFIKVEFGQTDLGTPGLRMSVSTIGSNGTGSLFSPAGPASVPIGWSNVVDSAATQRTAFISYAEGQLFLVYGYEGLSARGAMFHVGRPRDSAGARTTDGVLIWQRGSTGASPSLSFGVLRNGGGHTFYTVANPADSDYPCITNLANHDDQFGADYCVLPSMIAVGAVVRWASWLVVAAAATSGELQQNINVFGGLRNYRSLTTVFAADDIEIWVPYF